MQFLFFLAYNNCQRWRTKTSTSECYNTEDDQLRAKLKSLEEANLKLKTDKQILERQLLINNKEVISLRSKNELLSNELKQSLSIQHTFLTFFKADCPKYLKTPFQDVNTPIKLPKSKSGEKIKIFEDYDEKSIKSPLQYQSHHRSDDPDFNFRNEDKIDIIPAFARCLLADPDWKPRFRSGVTRLEQESNEKLIVSRPSVCDFQKQPKQPTSFSLYKNSAVRNKSSVSNYKPHSKGKDK